MVQTVQQAMEIPQLLLDKVLDVPVWQVLRVPQVQAVMMTVVISQLHFVDVQMVLSPRPLRVWAPQGAVHRLLDELKGGRVQRHTVRGVMSTGTEPPLPTIRCKQLVCMHKHTHIKHKVRTTSTTTTTRTHLGEPIVIMSSDWSWSQPHATPLDQKDKTMRLAQVLFECPHMQDLPVTLDLTQSPTFGDSEPRVFG